MISFLLRTQFLQPGTKKRKNILECRYKHVYYNFKLTLLVKSTVGINYQNVTRANGSSSTAHLTEKKPELEHHDIEGFKSL